VETQSSSEETHLQEILFISLW